MSEWYIKYIQNRFNIFEDICGRIDDSAGQMQPAKWGLRNTALRINYRARIIGIT